MLSTQSENSWLTQMSVTPACSPVGIWCDVHIQHL